MSVNPPVSSCPNGFIYIVQPGDTLFVIANRFGVTVNALVAANPQLVDPNTLFPGDRICVPTQTSPSCPGGTIYQVQSGDTMFFIAVKFGVSLDALIAANPQIPNPNVLIPGQKLCIPSVTPTIAPPPSCTNGFLYTVVSGDTLSAIAKRFGTTVAAILAVNPQISDPNLIFVGQKICIPIAPPPVTCPTLFEGSSGPDVVRLQTLLLQNGFNPGPIDGIFGPRTEAAVIAFQTARGLTVDGIVGVQTWTALGVNCLVAMSASTDSETVEATDSETSESAESTELEIDESADSETVDAQQTPVCTNGFLYTVVSGDTLSSIAARFGTTVSAILAVNPQITNPNLIFPGQQICIPTTPPPVNPCPTLVQGNTGPDVTRLQTLLLQNGFNPGPIDGIFGPRTEAAVIAFQTARGLIVDGIVGVQTWTALGVNCAVPPTTSAPPCPNGFIYTVVAGDTLSSIAARFGTTVAAILAVNPQITNPNLIFVGQKICIPTTPPPVNPCPTLVQGDTGPDVTRLQTLLLQNGFNPGPIDGIFGPMTEAAVIAFQTARGLVVDGIVGVQTWTALGVNCAVSSCPGFIYTVVAGDTLSSIAARFGTTVAAILAVNPQITNPNLIFVGQQICIPTVPPTTVTPPSCPNGFIYTIKAGDTLSALSNTFGIKLSFILSANPGINPNNLQIGQKICIPGPATCSGTIYTVVSGDTLSAIAARFGVTVNAILAANPQMSNPNVIFVGEKICIPILLGDSVSDEQVIPSCTNGFLYTVVSGDTLSSIAARFGTTVAAILAVNPQITNPNLIFPGQKICIPTTPPPVNPCPTLVQGDTGPDVTRLQTLLLQNGFSPGPIDGIFGPMTEAAVIAFQTAKGLIVDGIVGVQTWTALGVNCAVPTTVPPPPGFCFNGFILTIKAGDTLSKIAAGTGICLSAIIAANPGINPNNLQIGQQICIPGPVSCSGTIYTVVSGDTLSAIAARFGTTVSAILTVNPQICDANTIFVGEKICIPTVTPSSTPPPPGFCFNGFIFTIKAGDTLSKIAAGTGICLSAIIAANPGINPNNLQIGQQICIPGPVSCSGTIYTVVAGDTLSAIAARFGTTVSAILAVNPQICDPNTIFVGEKICIPGVTPPTTPPPPITCTNGFIYTVVAGDTLSGIAARFGICLSAIEAANPQITNPNLIFPGQQICIPGPATCSGFLYTVVAGDTLSAIAARFGTTVSAILAVNPQICDPNTIFVGEKICIPGVTPPTTPPPPITCTNGFIYTVVAGDTLSGIAARFGICLSAIEAANPQITNPNLIFPGQQICIPGPATCSGFLYTVVAGDTLSAIAARFGTTVSAILAANPQICDPNTIFVGEKICIPTTPTTPTPGPCPILMQGDTGPDVVRLQTLLLENGFNPGPIDGIFGPMTEAAVIAFQTAKGLTVDGIVGPETWMALGVQCTVTTLDQSTKINKLQKRQHPKVQIKFNK